MMPFSEKLTFLMHITETSNKELAAELSVDPSMVSLMRTGRRKLSKNPAQVKKMSFFFARRCPAAFQRQALSEMLELVSISPGMPIPALAACLELWLQGERPITDTFLSGIQGVAAGPESGADFSLPSLPSPGVEPQTLFFYGEEGRQAAMSRMMEELRSMETPGSVLTVVDDNLEWLMSNYLLTQKIQASFLELSERGFTFCQIMPSVNYVNRYAESLRFWLPIYATGRTEVYYYPRLRGNLYHHSIIVVPGRCVQYSASVVTGSTSDVTMVSTDPKLVSAFEKQFREHLSLCRPALFVHRDPRNTYPCYRDYFECRGEYVQMINSLSLCTLPRTLLERYVRETDDDVWSGTFQLYLDNLPSFEQKLETVPFLDLCRLFTAEEIRGGRVPVGSSSRDYYGQPWYTPETYCLHLKNILRLMDTYENYTFLPVHEKEYPDYDLFTNEDGLAIIVRTAKPLMTMEIRRQPMVIAFREHLLRKADAVGYEGIRRERIRMELRGLIQELGG